jgi:hypothetical protein
MDGALTSEEVSAVDRHLDECAGCRAESALLQWVSRVVQGLPRAEPEPDLRQRVLERVVAEARFERTRVLERRLGDPEGLHRDIGSGVSGLGHSVEVGSMDAGARIVRWQRYESRFGSTGHCVSEFVEWRVVR